MQLGEDEVKVTNGILEAREPQMVHGSYSFIAGSGRRCLLCIVVGKSFSLLCNTLGAVCLFPRMLYKL